MEQSGEVKGTPLRTSRISAGLQQQRSYIPTVKGKWGDEARDCGACYLSFPKTGISTPDIGGLTPVSAHYRHTRLCELSADVTKKGNLPVENSEN